MIPETLKARLNDLASALHRILNGPDGDHETDFILLLFPRRGSNSPLMVRQRDITDRRTFDVLSSAMASMHDDGMVRVYPHRDGMVTISLADANGAWATMMTPRDARQMAADILAVTASEDADGAT